MLPVLNPQLGWWSSIDAWVSAREVLLGLAEVVGRALGRVEQELRRALPAGRWRALGREDVAQAVTEVIAHADELLLEARHGRRGHDGAELAQGRGVRATVADVVGPVPHQLDRLAHLLRGLGGLERAVVEQAASERAAAGGHVHGHLVHLQADELGDLLLGRDRDLQRRPDLGPVGLDVGDGGVGLQGAVRGEGEGVLGLDHLLARPRLQLHRLARPPSALRSTVSSDSASLGPGPQSTWRALTASMHWPNVSPRTATPLAMGTTSVMPGIAWTTSRLLTLPTLPLIVGGRQTMQGLASGTSKVQGELLAAGHDVQGVDPPGGLPDDREVGFGLEFDLDGFRSGDGALDGQLPVGHGCCRSGRGTSPPWP